MQIRRTCYKLGCIKTGSETKQYIYKNIDFLITQQGCIKLIKKDSKDLSNVTKVSISNKCCFINFLFIKES